MSNQNTGKEKFSKFIRYKIAQYLEVSTDYLLYGSEEDQYVRKIYQLFKGKQPKEIEKMLQVMQIMAS